MARAAHAIPLPGHRRRRTFHEARGQEIAAPTICTSRPIARRGEGVTAPRSTAARVREADQISPYSRARCGLTSRATPQEGSLPPAQTGPQEERLVIQSDGVRRHVAAAVSLSSSAHRSSAQDGTNRREPDQHPTVMETAREAYPHRPVSLASSTAGSTTSCTGAKGANARARSPYLTWSRCPPPNVRSSPRRPARRGRPRGGRRWRRPDGQAPPVNR